MATGEGAGWHRESRRHVEAARKGKGLERHPSSDPKVTIHHPGSGEPPEGRYQVFVDNRGTSRTFKDPEAASRFARNLFSTRRYGKVQVWDNETDDEIERWG